MTPRKRFAAAAAVVVAAITGLIVWSLTGTTTYYKTPSELAAGSGAQQRLRVAGTVVADSVARDGATTTFAVTDGKAQIPVTTQDVLPDTFGTGVEVVAEGAMTSDGTFTASTVLAKCPSKFKAKVAATGR